MKYANRLIAVLLLAAGIATMPLPAAAQEDFDPDSVDLLDAINCRVTAPHYNSFALSLSENAEHRGWKKVETNNPFLLEYELPAPITVAGQYSTKRIAFAASAILAVLDLSDPSEIARKENIKNAVNPNGLADVPSESSKVARGQAEKEVKFRKFMGERVISDVTDPPDGEKWRAHTTIARSISNVSTDPDKTLYGCSYHIELLDKDGNPI